MRGSTGIFFGVLLFFLPLWGTGWADDSKREDSSKLEQKQAVLVQEYKMIEVSLYDYVQAGRGNRSVDGQRAQNALNLAQSTGITRLLEDARDALQEHNFLVAGERQTEVVLILQRILDALEGKASPKEDEPSSDTASKSEEKDSDDEILSKYEKQIEDLVKQQKTHLNELEAARKDPAIDLKKLQSLETKQDQTRKKTAELPRAMENDLGSTRPRLDPMLKEAAKDMAEAENNLEHESTLPLAQQSMDDARENLEKALKKLRDAQERKAQEKKLEKEIKKLEQFEKRAEELAEKQKKLKQETEDLEKEKQEEEKKPSDQRSEKKEKSQDLKRIKLAIAQAEVEKNLEEMQDSDDSKKKDGQENNSTPTEDQNSDKKQKSLEKAQKSAQSASEMMENKQTGSGVSSMQEDVTKNLQEAKDAANAQKQSLQQKLDEVKKQDQAGQTDGGGANKSQMAGQPGGSGELREKENNSKEFLPGLQDVEREKALQWLHDKFPERYRDLIEQYYRSLADDAPSSPTRSQ